MNIKKIKYNGKPAEALYSYNQVRLGFKSEVRSEGGAVITERIYVDRELRHLTTPEYFVYLISQHTTVKDYTNEILQNLADDVQAVEDNFNAITEE